MAGGLTWKGKMLSPRPTPSSIQDFGLKPAGPFLGYFWEARWLLGKVFLSGEMELMGVIPPFRPRR